ncbi:MAG: metallophosphoesterase [Armatimonadetes bacterium]|nr:metallophosphoesterase [Armatimonadota bacterium]
MPNAHEGGLKLSRRKLLKFGSLAVGGALFGEALAEPNRIETIRLTVPIHDLPTAFEGFRIGLLSDVHWGHNMDADFVGRAYGLLKPFKPDLIAIPGDIYHGQGQTPASAPKLAGAFDMLQAPFGVVGTLGNHDHRIGRRFVEDQIARYSAIRLLDNRSMVIEKGGQAIAVGGVGDLIEDVVLLDQAFEGLPPDIPRILLSHNPETAEHIDHDMGTRVDLQLSGHTHGGQIVIPGIVDPYSWFSHYGSKFNRGFVEGKRHRVFVSKGLARLNHMRLFAPPDVVCITLLRA